jgi:DNA-binding transcriptional regulator YiaG
MEQIPPEVARKILTRDFSNLISRVQSGGKLTRGERSMLQSIAAGSTGADAPTASNYHELAEILGVTRQSINGWKRMGDSPKASANGTHDVAAWREFMARKGLKGGAALAPDEESALRARKLLAEVMDREFRLAIKKGEYVPQEEVRSRWAYHVGQAVSLLRKRLENELPPILSGLDAIGIRKEMSVAIDEFAALLHEGQ